MANIVYSIIESPMHPNLSPLYQRLGMTEVKLTSIRKAINQLKKQSPAYIVAEFFYGYGNNYAGVNVSNLDVLLASLPKYSPDTKMIVMVQKSEHQYVEKLQALFPVPGVLVHPVDQKKLEELLKS